MSDGHPAAATKQKTSVIIALLHPQGDGASLYGLGDSSESTCGAVAAREALAIPAGDWVGVLLLLGPGQSHSHACAWPLTPVI